MSFDDDNVYRAPDPLPEFVEISKSPPTDKSE